jgi:ATP-binding cassette subfamily C protein
VSDEEISVAARKPIQTTSKMVSKIVRRSPRKTLLTVAVLSLGALAEGVGIALVLPLLGKLINPSTSGSGAALERIAERVFDFIGLPFSSPVVFASIIMLLGVRIAAGLAAAWQTADASATLAMDARLSLVDALLRARWQFFASLKSGNVAVAITTEARRVGNIFVATSKFFSNLIRVFLMMCVATAIAWELTLAAIAGGIVFSIAFRGVGTAARKLGFRQTELLTSMTALLVDGIAGLKPLVAMGRTSPMKSTLKRGFLELKSATSRSAFLLSLLPTLAEPMSVILIVIAAYFLVGSQYIAFEELIVIGLAFSRAVSGLAGIQANFQSIAGAEASFWFVEDLTQSANSARSRDHGRAIPTLGKQIAFEDVTFAYGDDQLFSKLNLLIPAHEFIVIQGRSGVGKTTLVDMVLGLNQPLAGQVTIDGTPIDQLHMDSWRKQIGYVPQEMYLFQDSVRNNIALEDPTILDEAIWNALRAAGADKFISSLPQGLDTIVGARGSTLSGGQRQRVSIARALVRRPSLLILDEATAGLDPRTAREIWATMRAITGTTVVAITHQSELADFADLLISVKSGGRVEIGRGAADPRHNVDGGTSSA